MVRRSDACQTWSDRGIGHPRFGTGGGVMIAETSGGGSRFFPEIRIRFRSSDPRFFSPRWQAAMLITTLAGIGVLACVGVTLTRYGHRVAEKAAAAAGLRTTNSDLQNQLNGLWRKLADLQRDRAQAQQEAQASAEQTQTLRDELASAEAKLDSFAQVDDQIAALRDNIAKLGTGPIAETAPKLPAPGAIMTATDEARQALQQEQARNAALNAQLQQIQSDRTAELSQLAQYKASLEQTAKDLAQFTALRGKVTIKRGRVRLQLNEIWQRLSQLRLPLPGPVIAAAGPTAQSSQVASTTPDAAPSVARTLDTTTVAAVENVLRSAGVNVGRIVGQIMSQAAPAGAEGGPFVPPPKSYGANTNGISAEKLAALEALSKTLPISAPLAHYEVGSRFGPRIDPFNHRAAFHTGIDMDAPYSSPVYATAPGTVIYAGWLGDYGQAVEIDHGFGIVTLYGHLRRCLVAVGQTVATQTEIGLLGTTGRSTGPHVHYEVRVDGQPQDPQKFLSLAHLLPVAAAGQVTRAGQVTPAVGGPARNSR